MMNTTPNHAAAPAQRPDSPSSGLCADIPADIWRVAGDAILAAGQALRVGDIAHEAIARAIAAERERCAVVADHHAQVLRGNFDRSCAIAVEGCAAAIRNGAA